MPLKLNVGLTKKIGQPNYGSLGASCHLEIELDPSLLFADLDGFHERVRSTFIACRQAVFDELARARSAANGGQAVANEPAALALAAAPSDENNHEALTHRESPPPQATAKQVDYARRLAGQIRGLGTRRLETLTRELYSKPLADLSAPEASALIDSLLDIRSGKVSLDTAWKGAAA
jgi:hypothetical protein